MRTFLAFLSVPASLLTAFVALQLVFAVMTGLNGIIPGQDPPALLRPAVALLLLNTLILAWTAFFRRTEPRRAVASRREAEVVIYARPRDRRAA